MYENMNKNKSRNNSSRKNQSPAKAKTEQPDEINLMKPNFMKKKAKNVDVSKEEEQTNKLYEGVWNDEE